MRENRLYRKKNMTKACASEWGHQHQVGKEIEKNDVKGHKEIWYIRIPNDTK